MEYKPSFVDQLDVDYIAHHGIKGQKWGVRRFQNPDGTLTSQGKKRYNGYLIKTGKDPDIVYDKQYGYALWSNKSADKGDELRKKGLTGDETFTLTKKQKIGFGLTAPVSFPIALSVDAQHKKAIADSKRRENVMKLEQKQKKYQKQARKQRQKLNKFEKQQQKEFESVFGKNKQFNYMPIYKEMHANMNIDDNDYYKEIYYKWRKKHGFTD